ncbi:hypothetical protein N7533_000504 [Penicillium manginii]|uniref:uncharacterized protein n=1 Tax=Penicillium manginii TaxID=203109 RepID=UPI002548E305|nr:uncharacterized protein N7533_000504 [Penicillium manginii]KAJ5767921.1 hypothetical protein N7533_000504 [Penicillium manginii]
MPRPARHDELPRWTGQINWECLGSMVDGTDAEPASTVEDRCLPVLGTDSLPLPRGILDATNRSKLSQDPYQTQNFLGPLSNHADLAIEFFPIQYMESSLDTVSPRSPSNNQSMSGRLQQCQHALQSLGFPSVDAFALEYYTARLGPLPKGSGVEQREGLSTLDRLLMLLQNELPRLDTMDANNLHQVYPRFARDLCIVELRNIDHASYDPDKAEDQVSEVVDQALHMNG